MKRFLSVSIAVAVALMLTGSSQAEVYSSEYGDFDVHFWKEMFKGGGPGQPGNTLMANGEGYLFKQAELLETYFDETLGRWITTYVDGALDLNSRGPWLDRGVLKATGITATNSSVFDPETGELDFILTFSGEFDNKPGVYFEAEATYNGIPEIKYDPYGNPDFQRGFDYIVTITIDEE